MPDVQSIQPKAVPTVNGTSNNTNTPAIASWVGSKATVGKCEGETAHYKGNNNGAKSPCLPFLLRPVLLYKKRASTAPK